MAYHPNLVADASAAPRVPSDAFSSGQLASLRGLLQEMFDASEARQEKRTREVVTELLQPEVTKITTALNTEREQRIADHKILESRIAALERSPEISSASLEDTVVIGGFSGRYSKMGALEQVRSLTLSREGFVEILSDRVGEVPTVVLVRFASGKFASDFVNTMRDQVPFAGFWCNISRSKADRDRFQKEFGPLYKLREGLVESLNFDRKALVVDKRNEKIMRVIGMDLQEVACFKSISEVTWHVSIPVPTRDHCMTLLRQ